MIDRRTAAIAALMFALAYAVPGRAFPVNAYDSAALAAAQKAGKVILVDVTAPWCPTCRAQQAVLGDLAKLERFKDLIKFEVDFDSRKDVLKALRVTSQSTLIVFKGDKEVGRLAGDARRASIEALLAKAY